MAEIKATILARILSAISDSYDKTERSFFYDLEEPIAIELANLSTLTDEILSRAFVDTATGEYLDKIAGGFGITRKPAAKATTTVTITGSEGSSIAIGDKVASDTVNFLVTEAKTIAAGQTTMSVTVECETAGIIGNVPVGAIKYFPITIAGLTAVTNAISVTNGYDEETDEELRTRFYIHVQTPATSGNIYHYMNWSNDTTGVGATKVFPIWNGNGTVKVVIINSNKRAADSTLIDSVTANIEANRPIGATVTVISASELAINVVATLSLDTGYVLADVTTAIETALTEHLADIAFIDTYVSYAKVGSIILDVPGVLDYSNLTINSGTSNVSIGNEQVAVLGTVMTS